MIICNTCTPISNLTRHHYTISLEPIHVHSSLMSHQCGHTLEALDMVKGEAAQSHWQSCTGKAAQALVRTTHMSNLSGSSMRHKMGDRKAATGAGGGRGV